jgi:hypothetical protein
VFSGEGFDARIRVGTLRHDAGADMNTSVQGPGRVRGGARSHVRDMVALAFAIALATPGEAVHNEVTARLDGARGAASSRRGRTLSVRRLGRGFGSGRAKSSERAS